MVFYVHSVNEFKKSPNRKIFSLFILLKRRCSKSLCFFFPFLVPSDGVLCSMKIAAMLVRAKGRDFYDLMFLLSQTKPDYDFLSKRCGIGNWQEFKEATDKLLETVDLKKKHKDFEHLLFNKMNSEKILRFGDFLNSLTE
ncbi:hypothetical protein EZS27_029870 [termite gut metagenome]|uniref:Uncharacterized protein n=2 Tax=termite gut metagenome TaxID=433724 RepID=A0A5J4QE95_9ZZZZ